MTYDYIHYLAHVTAIPIKIIKADFTEDIQRKVQYINTKWREACALLEGGNLYKVRMPLPKTDPKERIPANIEKLAEYMRQHYTESGQWWTANHTAIPTAENLPADLQPKQKAPGEPNPQDKLTPPEKPPIIVDSQSETTEVVTHE